MRAEFWAILTAICWSIGSFFEKKGIKAGHLEPVMGTVIRTSVSLAILLLASHPYWKQIKAAGVKPILMIAFGGGLLAGALGIFSLYKALSTGAISSVLTLAFCLTPVFGAVIGVVAMHEKLTMIQGIGIIMTITGASMTAFFRNPIH